MANITCSNADCGDTIQDPYEEVVAPCYSTTNLDNACSLMFPLHSESKL